jgi:uncharacterized membrane protein YqjE
MESVKVAVVVVIPAAAAAAAVVVVVVVVAAAAAVLWRIYPLFHHTSDCCHTRASESFPNL